MKGSIQQTKTDRHIPYYSISNTITTYTMYTRPQSIPVYTSKGRQYGRKTLCYLYNIDKQIGNQVHRSQDRMLKKSETKMNLSEYRGKKGLQVLTYKLTYTISWVTGYGKLKLQKKLHFVWVQERTMGRPQILIDCLKCHQVHAQLPQSKKMQNNVSATVEFSLDNTE